MDSGLYFNSNKNDRILRFGDLKITLNVPNLNKINISQFLDKVNNYETTLLEFYQMGFKYEFISHNGKKLTIKITAGGSQFVILLYETEMELSLTALTELRDSL